MQRLVREAAAIVRGARGRFCGIPHCRRSAAALPARAALRMRATAPQTRIVDEYGRRYDHRGDRIG
jgi:hypothetical protein